MEDDIMDDLYGDLDDHPSGMSSHDDEESVDIYSGLESSPKVDGNKRKPNHLLSPRTIESMDIYEELIREEQEEKEATYNELKEKFEASQSQIKELVSKLQLLQTKNSSLNNENTLLKKNICSLIKTARMEIVRKDEEITRLSNRSGRGCYSQIFHQSPTEMGHANTRHTLNNVFQHRDSRQDRVTNEVNKPKGKNTVLDKSTISAVAPQPFEVLQRCPRNDLENPLNCQKENSAARTIQPQQETKRVDPNRASDDTKHLTSIEVADASVSHKQCNAGLTVPSSTSDSLLEDSRRLEDCKNCPSGQVHMPKTFQTSISLDKGCNFLDRDISQKAKKKFQDNSGKPERTEAEHKKNISMSTETKNHPPEVPVVLKGSGRSKSPSTQEQKTVSPEVFSQSFKTSVKTCADVETHSKENIQVTDIRTYRKTTCVVDEASHSQKNKMKKLDSSSLQRKDEKKQGTSFSAERRTSRTERHREQENRPKESGRSKRDDSYRRGRESKSNSSDINKEYERRSAKEVDKKEENKKCREWRSRKQADALDTRHASPKLDFHGRDVCKEKASSKIEESLLNSKKSHSPESSRKKVFRSPDKNEKLKHKDRGRKRDGRCEEKMVPKGGKSKDVTRNKDQVDSLHKKDRVMREGQPCKDKNKHLESLHKELPPTVPITGKTKEDNSPDRKLSFMETLNLTLSPLKKQRSSCETKVPIKATAEDASADNSNLSELGEEFFVVDELQNSQQSVEVIEDSEPTTLGKQKEPTSYSKNSGQVDDLFPSVTFEKSLAEEINMEAQEHKVAESQQAVDVVSTIETFPEKKSDKKSDLSALDEKLNISKPSQNCSGQDCTENILRTIDNPALCNSLCIEISPKLTVLDSAPDSIVDWEKQDPIPPVCEKTSPLGILPKSPDSVLSQNGICQENVSSTDKVCNIPTSNSTGISDSPVFMEVSSSTVTVDCTVVCNPVEGSTFKQDNEGTSHTSENLNPVEMSSDNLKMSEKPHKTSLLGQDTTSTNVTVREETTSYMKASFSEPDSTAKDEQNLRPSSSDVLCHDEDSMMLTLRNIKIIPEAISPLTSPIRQVKRVIQPLRADKQPHVKSLSKDLSTVSAKVNMDMNKENESPDSSVSSAPQKGIVDGLSVSGTEEEELEDGEIVSESEEEGPLFIQTPPREQDKSTSRSYSNPKLSSAGKRESQKKSCGPVKCSKSIKSSVTSATSTCPTSTKRRFKTVSLPFIAAVHTVDEFMDRLSNIRVKLRRKYMKLHKNVTTTAFCSIVEMSQASFTEFVNAVDFDKLCHESNNIKINLSKIIGSIMSKLAKNGIVNRIFDQKAEDLKQKLWTFVDGQFDFLFKELRAALKNSSDPFVNTCTAEDKNTSVKEKEVVEKDLETSAHRAKKAKVEIGNCSKETPSVKMPPRGLGSRGKNIKAVMQEEDEPTDGKISQLPTLSSEKSVVESTLRSENKSLPYIRRLSNNASTNDKSDFEILTEQQTSSLTYNLVADSQMGEIFKCLLQGSDLLEPSLTGGDSQCWPVSTPRKEEATGDSLTGIMTPYKTTASIFITPWSSISPYKLSSNSKMIVDPAILDESCLLEVPSTSEPSRGLTQSTVTSQRTFSILADDLAVSLTIPSPLKSDSHLSFLHPGTGQPLSAPNSVMSAHYSEDALDGEDHTEQDIHLSLDTDNSSCGSSPDRAWENTDPPGFQFKPNLPMQAVVMEKSNDHFIVRIRHTSTSPAESGQNEEKNGFALAKEQELTVIPNQSQDLGPIFEKASDKILGKSTESCHFSDKTTDAHPSNQKSSSEDTCNDNKAEQVSSDVSLEVRSSAEVKTTEERKRKKHYSEPKAKRSKVDKPQDKHRKSRHTRKSQTPKETSPKVTVSPIFSSSLSAKNVIRKKGEVVVAWTRDEDRDILVELKMKGASPKTFAALSKRLKKSTEQIEERFAQLMKLFKKKEKMEN